MNAGPAQEYPLLIRNCRLYTSAPGEPPTDILIIDGAIAGIDRIEPGGKEFTVVDAGGRIAAPGAIDMHIHGAGGVDTLDGTRDALQTMSKTLAHSGTTAFLGAMVPRPAQGNRHVAAASDAAAAGLDGAALLGIYLEGPFINLKRRGGISDRSILPPTRRALDEIMALAGGWLKIMTVAPEIPGNAAIIRALLERGVMPAFGHSDASYEEAKGGFEAGIRHVTHVLNAMAPMHHRAPGPLAAIVEDERVTVEVISDGNHLHPGIVRMIHRLVGRERCVCISDAVQAMGLPEGTHMYDGRPYESKNGAARFRDGTLVGSTMSLWQIAANFLGFTRCSLREAVDAVTLRPARILGIDSKKGSLRTGMDADIVLLNSDSSVHLTVVRGKIFRSATEPEDLDAG